MTIKAGISGIKSRLMSLDEIVNNQDGQWLFNVPIYQRLYVWGEDQINTLLSDIENACSQGEDEFFIGGAMVVEKTERGAHEPGIRVFDLIDGQQRFTTLWLLGTVLPGSLSLHSFSSVQLAEGKIPRLHFSIRDTVNEYLQSLLSDSLKSQEEMRDTNSLRKAQMLMQSFFGVESDVEAGSEAHKRIQRLSDYIFKNVKLVMTRVPDGMDLNKLFEVVNNRGVQLQHHEILKSQLLHSLNTEERNRYAAIWDACSDMNGFIERNLAALTPINVHEMASLYERGKLSDSVAVGNFLSEKEAATTGDARLSLEDIIGGKVCRLDADADTGKSVDGYDNNVWARSIVSFPLFLQHTLRIWLYKNKLGDIERLRDKELLDIFRRHFFVIGNSTEDKADNARDFIALLWELRVLWDNYVIKWVDQGEDEVHLLCSATVTSTDNNGKSYINRSRESDSHQGLGLLQSMLYHSQEITTHYWLTPYLNYLRKAGLSAQRGRGALDVAYSFLRHLDNHLLGEVSDQPLVERSRRFMAQPWHKAKILSFEWDLSMDAEPKGVNFAHYWFYKLDFVLWESDRYRGRYWEKFRFTAKNSIEHISPQTPKSEDRHVLSASLVDSFGNLGLVSRSINSEYSNLPYNEKKQRFENKREYEKRPESLKMDVIYRQPTWGDDMAIEHHREMLQVMKEYYNHDFRRDAQEAMIQAVSSQG